MRSEYRVVQTSDKIAPDAPGQGEPPAAKLGRILPDALKIAWDRLGLLAALSLTWTAAFSLLLSTERWLPRNAPLIFHFLILAVVPIVMALPTVGIFSIAHRIAAHEEAGFAHLWEDGLALFRPAVRLMLLQVIAAALLAIVFGFYLKIPAWFGRAGLTVSGYVILMWLLMLVYQWPVLVAQEKGLFDEPERPAKRGAFPAIRRSFYIALGRPFLAAALVGIMLLLSILMTVTVVLSPLLWIGVIAILSTIATRALLVQFGILPPPSLEEPIPDLQFRIKVDTQKSPRT